MMCVCVLFVRFIIIIGNSHSSSSFIQCYITTYTLFFFIGVNENNEKNSRRILNLTLNDDDDDADNVRDVIK